MASQPVENSEVPPASQEVQKNAEEEEEVNPEPQEAKMPTRKDVSLKEFLNKMDDYAPIVSFLHWEMTRRSPSAHAPACSIAVS